jgi:hypothetical protein
MHFAFVGEDAYLQQTLTHAVVYLYSNPITVINSDVGGDQAVQYTIILGGFAEVK